MIFTHKLYRSSKSGGSLKTTHFAVLLGENENSDDMWPLLTRRGVNVVLISAKRRYSSDLGRNAYENDDIKRVANEFADYLNRYVVPDENAVIISSGDIYVVLLALAETKLADRFSFRKISWDLVKQFSNKIEFSALCDRLKIDTPKTIVLKSEEDLVRLAGRIPYPGIVKSHYPGAVPKDVMPKVLKIGDEDELNRVARDVWASGHPILYQDWVPGGSDMVWFVGGLISAPFNEDNIFVGQKLLEDPLLGGTTTYAKLSWNEDVLNIARKFVQDVGYQGLVDIELKYDVRDQKFKMIEVNPRIGRWHSISDTGRIDAVSLFFAQKAGIEIPAAQLHIEGRTWIDPHLALCGFIERQGMFVGFVRWIRALVGADIRAGVELGNLKKTAHQLRVVLGHIRSLGVRAALFGQRAEIPTPQVPAKH